MRIVVDTSVLISALLWSGLPHRILELAEAKRVTFCATDYTLAELRGVLGRPKFRPRLSAQNTSIATIMQGIISMVELYPHVPLPGSVPADPDDDNFVSCAMTADAAYLISGDAHLLSLGQVKGIRLLSVREFLDLEFPDLTS